VNRNETVVSVLENGILAIVLPNAILRCRL